jgi:hypothetical protein
MSASQQREAENRSAALAACALGARAKRLDAPGAGDRDFDLVFLDGHREPLEITSNVIAAVRQTSARLEGNPFPLDGTQRVWLLGIDERTAEGRAIDVRRIVEDAPLALRTLEAAGEIGLGPRLAYDASRPDIRDAARALHSMGVRLVSSYVPSDERPVMWISSGSGGWIHADAIADTVEAAAADPGNRAKLLAPASAPRRHLLVTPALSGGVAYTALLDIFGGDERMPRVPTLPEPITTVWAASDSGAIYVSPPGAWTLFRTPEGFWDRYEDFLIVS